MQHSKSSKKYVLVVQDLNCFASSDQVSWGQPLASAWAGLRCVWEGGEGGGRGAEGVRERHAGGGGRGAGQHSRICNKHVLVVQDLVCFDSTD